MLIKPLVPIFIRGRAHLMTFDASPNRDPLQMGISDILELIAAKDPRPIGHWRELSAEEYTRSFAVAQTAGYSVVREIYDGLVQSFGNKETSDAFVERLLPFLRKRGWLGDEGKVAPRLKLIYDTNLRVSRGVGRYDRYARTSAAFPYLRGVTARDERVRHPPKSPDSDHRAFDGIILPFGHSFWLRYWVPLGFNCRCSIIQMTRSQLARYPGGITSEAELEERIARLGEPIFASPASFNAQIADLAGIANENRLPGQKALDMTATRFTAERLLQAQLLEEGIDQIAELLNRIFGIAA